MGELEKAELISLVFSLEASHGTATLFKFSLSLYFTEKALMHGHSDTDRS